MKRPIQEPRYLLWVLVLSLPAWVARLAFYKRYVYMGFDQARDSFIFHRMASGEVPAYGPYALSGGYYMPNYFYRFYSVVNFIDKSDPVYQTLPFVVLSATGVSMLMVLVWMMAGMLEPKLRLRYKLALLGVPLLLIGFSHNELINTPLMWNPANLVFWQMAIFLAYVRIQRRVMVWGKKEALATWAAFGAVSVLAASMHGTFLYAVPLWAAGLLAYHVYRRRWSALAYLAGAAAALAPFIRIESQHNFENILVMLGRGGRESGQIQNGLDFSILQNLWNNISQFSHKVIFGQDKPELFWAVLLSVIMAAGLLLMATKYRSMRWYAWWVAIYLVMASLFKGERGDTIVSWHYQQNIMLLPALSVVVILLFVYGRKRGAHTRPFHHGMHRALHAVTALVLVIFIYGIGTGMVRMLGRQYHAAYKPDHTLMTTYQMERAIALLPPGSTVCVPYGYYHPSTFEYLAQVRMGRTGDVFQDVCTAESEYTWILKHYYTFWPPHYAVQVRADDLQRFSVDAEKQFETYQFIIFKRVAPAQ